MTPIPPTERERCPTCDRPTEGGDVRPLVDALDQKVGDAVPILRAMRDVPFERRMDAVAVAVDAFIRTNGRLGDAHERTEGRAGDGEGQATPDKDKETDHG